MKYVYNYMKTYEKRCEKWRFAGERGVIGFKQLTSFEGNLD